MKNIMLLVCLFIFLVSKGNTQASDADLKSRMDDTTRQNIAQALWMEEYDETLIPDDLLAKIKSDKNSNGGYAARFKTYLEQLKKTDISFITSRDDRYKVMMQYADARSPQQCYANMLFLGPESVTGYDMLPKDPQFRFPDVDNPQWRTQIGWHFFVGNFTDALGNHYSVQFMFWRYALLPPDLAARLGLSDIENQTVEMHLAISDQQTDTHYRANTVNVAGTTGLIGFTPKPYAYTLGRNGITSLTDSGDLFPVRLTGRGWDMGKTPNAEIEIDLSLSNAEGDFLEGDKGNAPNVDGIGTLYYSAANLKLVGEADNTITIQGKKIRLTDGSMWYDHQWGTGFMPNGAPQHAVFRAAQNLSKPVPGGWDWFMVQFDRNDSISKDGEVQICMASLHSNENGKYYWQAGLTPPESMTASFKGKYIDAKNKTRDITGSMQVTDWVKNSSSPNPAVYPPTNTWYPAKYLFTINEDVPEPIRQFTLTPLISSGQTGFFAMGLQYIEGGAVATDSKGKEIGRGFAEGTNYADSRKGIVTLAGLPVNEFTLTFLSAPKVSFLQKFSSFLYVAFHKKELEKLMAEARGL